MKVLTALFLFYAGLSAVARAQQSPAAAAAGPPELTVVKWSWARELVPGWDSRPTGAEPYDAMRARVSAEQRVQRERNAGSKGGASRAEDEARVYEKANAENKAKASERPRFGYRYKIAVKNDGRKAVKSIDWDYVFLDPDTQAEVERHQFTSDEKIAPGKQKELSVFKLGPPTRTVSARAEDRKDAPPFLERIVLVRVLYSDGSAWPSRQGQ
ncbi:MAG: hypothetical protein JOZ96_21915 [Acidobacteria bacterium]|nr:hypothetical protein [Acidobacteriota bacterium]